MDLALRAALASVLLCLASLSARPALGQSREEGRERAAARISARANSARTSAVRASMRPAPSRYRVVRQRASGERTAAAVTTPVEPDRGHETHALTLAAVREHVEHERPTPQGAAGYPRGAPGRAATPRGSRGAAPARTQPVPPANSAEASRAPATSAAATDDRPAQPSEPWMDSPRARALLEGSLRVPGLTRRVLTARNGKIARATLRVEGDRGAGFDLAADEAYVGAGLTYQFFREVYGRDSVDDRGMEIVSVVHYDRDYDNAFWSGRRMYYGDGDGKISPRGTHALEIIGHELTHGITGKTARLEYRGQAGALNESFSDVMGVLVKQWTLGQSAHEADWLIERGFDLARPELAGRSMADPHAGGWRWQPAHMDEYVRTRTDDGGVHINSGIPNRAFYLAAQRLGGQAWGHVGRVWYLALRHVLGPRATFRHAAEATIRLAGEMYGAGSPEQVAIRESWADVGIIARLGPNDHEAVATAARRGVELGN